MKFTMGGQLFEIKRKLYGPSLCAIQFIPDNESNNYIRV